MFLLSKMVLNSMIRGKKFIAEWVSSICEIVPALRYEQEMLLMGNLVNVDISC
jgi:hypothetical protein